MKTSNIIYVGLTIFTIFLMACTQTMTFTNPMLKPWEGAYQGIPAFDRVKVADVKPAMLKAMDLSLEEMEAIASNSEPPTFENTIEEMERSGAPLDRAFAYYGVFRSNLSSPEFREVQSELAPLFSEFQSKITQNEALFQRVKTIYKNSKDEPLPSDQQRVVELTYQSFAMSGANLDAEKKKRYAEINKELSTLYTNFSNNVLHDEENYVTYLTEDQLDGLPDAFIKSAT